MTAGPPTARRTLVLASASPARLRLLREAGFDPTVVVSGVDELSVTAEQPFDLVRMLAEAKARAVAAGPGVTDALVVGCDSMLLFDGEVLGRPMTPDDATLRWKRMRGHSGALLTGHCVVDVATGRVVSDVADTVVRFGDPSDNEIAAYVASGEPLRVAGAFTLDGRSAPFIEGVEGDPSNVIGLSLPLLRRLLGMLGVELTSLWR
jgi:septum formation protein